VLPEVLEQVDRVVTLLPRKRRLVLTPARRVRLEDLSGFRYLSAGTLVGTHSFNG